MMTIKYIDLFAGIGGFRIGFENAAQKLGHTAKCVFTSEIKPAALATYSANFGPTDPIDITNYDVSKIPDFDVLLGGFPCQAFSSAGKRDGFLDTRGTLFFDIQRILEVKRPKAFILENVEGLVNHDPDTTPEPYGKTLRVIITNLQTLGYKVTWKVLNAADFNLAQSRKRIFITGTLKKSVSLEDFPAKRTILGKFLEANVPSESSKTIDLILSNYKVEDLGGKSLKDKRGGDQNIHSWDIGLKGRTTVRQRELLNALLKARRNKKWGEAKGIKWMDGMPLTISEIETFFVDPKLTEMLSDLTAKGYVTFEHPKDLKPLEIEGTVRLQRVPRTDLEAGYNIVAGKLSFEVSKFLDANSVAPTLVATDVERIMVVQNKGLRKLTEREMLRLFGFPEKFTLVTKNYRESCDLMGNTIAVNVVEAVSGRLLETLVKG
jgi:DNA (cytosine-5)-methyltransferase 1